MRPLRADYPFELKTIADHLKKKRFDLELIQKEVAMKLGITEDCYYLWEGNKALPQVHHMPKIIAFLGYIPVSIDVSTIMGRIKYYRFMKGLSHKRMGKLLNVNATTIGAWENGVSIPHPENSKQLEGLFETIF